MSDPCFLYFSNIFIEYELAFKIINKLLVFRSIEWNAQILSAYLEEFLHMYTHSCVSN